MTKIDQVLSTLPKLAAKVMPSFTFTFSLKYFEKDNLFQLSFFKDYGHADGPALFLQGVGQTTEEAANVLLANFVAWTVEQSDKRNAEFFKMQTKYRDNIVVIATVVAEAETLANESNNHI